MSSALSLALMKVLGAPDQVITGSRVTLGPGLPICVRVAFAVLNVRVIE
jgi:hypothetical protein